MSNDKPKDRRGTFQDWPFELAILSALVMPFTGSALITVLFVFLTLGMLTLWLARRGAFSPRRD